MLLFVSPLAGCVASDICLCALGLLNLEIGKEKLVARGTGMEDSLRLCGDVGVAVVFTERLLLGAPRPALRAVLLEVERMKLGVSFSIKFPPIPIRGPPMLFRGPLMLLRGPPILLRGPVMLVRGPLIVARGCEG